MTHRLEGSTGISLKQQVNNGSSSRQLRLGWPLKWPVQPGQANPAGDQANPAGNQANPAARRPVEPRAFLIHGVFSTAPSPGIPFFGSLFIRIQLKPDARGPNWGMTSRGRIQMPMFWHRPQKKEKD